MKTKLLALSLPILFFMLPLKGQVIKSKLDLVAGISAREFLHTGLRYQYSEFTQFGVFVGGDLELEHNENITTLNIDHMLHFGKHNFYSNRPVWYQRLGFTVVNNKIGDYSDISYSYLNLALGRELAFSDRLGVNFDFGLNWQFKKNAKESINGTFIDNGWFVLPLARIQFFFSF